MDNQVIPLDNTAVIIDVIAGDDLSWARGELHRCAVRLEGEQWVLEPLPIK